MNSNFNEIFFKLNCKRKTTSDVLNLKGKIVCKVRVLILSVIHSPVQRTQKKRIKATSIWERYSNFTKCLKSLIFSLIQSNRFESSEIQLTHVAILQFFLNKLLAYLNSFAHFHICVCVCVFMFKVFSRVCLSTGRRRVPMWPLPMMHWTSTSPIGADIWWLLKKQVCSA